jgi:hypothetical protein
MKNKSIQVGDSSEGLILERYEHGDGVLIIAIKNHHYVMDSVLHEGHVGLLIDYLYKRLNKPWEYHKFHVINKEVKNDDEIIIQYEDDNGSLMFELCNFDGYCDCVWVNPIGIQQIIEYLQDYISEIKNGG